uniref:Glycosyltransferase family 92 protein n=1 Tax=Caenorhabditis japonica TaxID=281687 RepID=A0A8R1IFZ7_CAEJA
MRWLLLLFCLAHVTLLTSIYKYELPNVQFPRLDAKLNLPTGGHEHYLPSVGNPVKNMTMVRYGQFYGFHYGIDNVHGKLSDEDLADLERRYKTSVTNWTEFNNASTPWDRMDYVPYENPSPWNWSQITTYRRVVLDEALLQRDETSRKALAAGVIDFFDEYLIQDNCFSITQMWKIRETYRDLQYVRRGKVHYVRQNYICNGVEFGEDHRKPCRMDTDETQGIAIKALRNFTMRVTNGAKVLIKMWRSFSGCEVHGVSMGPYPPLRERLEDLGFPEEILSEPLTPEQLLALRRFSLPRLGEWRYEIAHIHLYTERAHSKIPKQLRYDDREYQRYYKFMKERNITSIAIDQLFY